MQPVSYTHLAGSTAPKNIWSLFAPVASSASMVSVGMSSKLWAKDLVKNAVVWTHSPAIPAAGPKPRQTSISSTHTGVGTARRKVKQDFSTTESAGNRKIDVYKRQILKSPYEVAHTQSSLKSLADELIRLSNACCHGGYRHLSFSDSHLLTGARHFRCCSQSAQHEKIHKYSTSSIAPCQAKTDKIDSVKIAGYGIDNRYHLLKMCIRDSRYAWYVLFSSLL